MKTYLYNINGKQIEFTLDGERPIVREILVDGHCPVPSEQEMPAYAAVICLALLEHEVEEVHDEEEGRILLRHNESHWGIPEARRLPTLPPPASYL